MKPVSVDIVTGFLGSGKTTLLRHVLEHGLSGERVAVVVNELGEVGIDGPVLTGLDAVERMVELGSGCVCCSIDELRFEMAMQELVHETDPTLILLETTGVAEPQATAERVRQAGLSVDAVITTVDVAHFARALRFGGTARRQVAGADFVVLTKTDLVGLAAQRRVQRRVARIQPRATLLTADHGDLGSDLPFATSVARLRGGLRPSQDPSDAPGPGEDHGLEAVTVALPSFVDRQRFELAMAALPESVVRAKGVVRFDDGTWHCLFNYVCGRCDLNWVRLPADRRPADAVFIGAGVGADRERIAAALADCATG